MIACFAVLCACAAPMRNETMPCPHDTPCVLRPPAQHGDDSLATMRALALEELRATRRLFSDLPAHSITAARLIGVVDFFLGSASESPFTPEALREYRETKEWLTARYPDLAAGILSVKILSSHGQSPVVNFAIQTREGYYVLSLQTRSVGGDFYSWPHTRVEGLEGEGSYRLEDIMTGAQFPLELPYAYRASYLRGETDRFGNSFTATQNGGWSVKPGVRKGDFQLLRVIPADDLGVKWEDVIASPVAGDPVHMHAFTRDSGRQTHRFVQDPVLHVASDVITAPGLERRGASLVAAFPRGNAGIAFLDRATDSGYEIDNITTVRRGESAQRGVSFTVRSPSPEASFALDDMVLDSMRAIREWQSPDAGRTRRARVQEFSKLIADLPLDVHVRLQREGISLAAIALRNRNVIRFNHDARGNQHVYVLRHAVDGHLYIAEMVFSSQCSVDIRSDGIFVRSRDGMPLEWQMVTTTDFPALEPLSRRTLFSEDALAYAQESPSFAHRLDEVEFLAFREFFAAGAHRFLQYFSRDTLIWLRMFYPALTPRAHTYALQGVLDRVAQDGMLPTVEELHDQVAYELIEEFCAVARQAALTRDPEDYGRVVDVARALHDSVPASRLKYGVHDVSFMFLPAVVDYLRRPDITPEEKAEFLRYSNAQGPTNLVVLLRNVEWVLRTAQRYVRARQEDRPWPAGLVATGDGFIGNWRDVSYGLGYGRYPADINAELAPMALEAAHTALDLLLSLPLTSFPGDYIGAEAERYELRGVHDYLTQGPQALRALEASWNFAHSHIGFTLDEQALRARLLGYLAQGPVSENDRRWFLQQPLGQGVTVEDFLSPRRRSPAIFQGGVRYFPVSLDDEGAPVPVVASDEIFELFDETISPARVVEILTPLFLPYPCGLWTPSGMLAASAALSGNERLWGEISRNAYGGSVVYGWQMEYLKSGIIRQIARMEHLPRDQVDRNLLEVLYSALELCCATDQAGETQGHELWTWNVDESGFHCVPFGALQGHNDDSNPVQLWSLSPAQMIVPRVRGFVQDFGVRQLPHPEFLDALAALRQAYPAPTVAPPVMEEALLPRIAVVSYSLPPGGGGVNIVVQDQVTTLRHAGYPVTLVGGQVLSWTPEENRAPASDNIYAREGIALHIIPGLDLQDDVERRAWAGELSPEDHDFRSRVEVLKAQLRDALADTDVVLIHQMMTMPGNLVATVALRELAREYRSSKRFVAWVHNTIGGRATQWPLTLITSHDDAMEYVAVSPQLRDETAGIFGVDQARIGVINNSVSARNFLGISPEVLDFYFSHRLYEADSVWFYPSRMARTKLLEAAIWAVCEAVYHQGKDVRLVISTPAPHGDLPTAGAEGDYLRELMRLVDELGLHDKVVIYPHNPDPRALTETQREIRDWYRLSDLLIFVSQVETFGIPIVEAMMSGTLYVRVDLPELERLTRGIDHVVFGKKPYDQSVERYGKDIGYRIVEYLGDNPAYVRAKQAQRYALSRLSSEAVISGVVSAWLSVPAPAARAIASATRNFRGDLIEGKIAEASAAGFPFFEVNFEGFGPGDIDAQGRATIRRALENGHMRCGVRICDLASFEESARARIIDDAITFSREVGAGYVTVRVDSLDAPVVAMLKEAGQRAREAGAFLSVENVSTQGRIFMPHELNAAFEGSPVGLSMWADVFDYPVAYISNVHMRLAALYAGTPFFTGDFDKQNSGVVAALRWMRENAWTGPVVEHFPFVSLADCRAIVDRAIERAYMPSDSVLALYTGDVNEAAVIHASAVSPGMAMRESS